MNDLIVRPVETARDLDAFIKLPWRIYADEPLWVPPLRKEMRQLLSPKHPFWAGASGQYFLAERRGRVVGRIAAIMDRTFIAYRRELAGAWGFFECENDVEAARGLFEAARSWCASQGLSFFRGPFSPSTNYEIGMLIQGFDLPPTIMMPYNPSYYPALVEECGLVKEMDLLAFLFRRGHAVPEWARSLSRRLCERGEVSIRNFRKSQINEDLRLVAEIYEQAWGDHWGFTPMSQGEMEVMAKSLLPILDEDMGIVLSVGDETVGVGLALPDVNPLLRRLNGKVGLSGLYKFMRYKSEIQGARALLFGIKPKYQQMGVPLVAMEYLLEMSNKKTNLQWVEMSWNLETNEAINGLLTDCGGKHYKTYRIYRQNC